MRDVRVWAVKQECHLLTVRPCVARSFFNLADIPTGPLGGGFLWPAHAWRRSLDGQHLTRPPSVGHGCGTTPLGRHQKQRSPVGAPEHAGEAAAIEIDRLQDLAALANAHAALVGDVSVPDGVLRIEADAIGNAVAEIGPHASLRKVPSRQRGDSPNMRPAIRIRMSGTAGSISDIRTSLGDALPVVSPLPCAVAALH